MRGRRSRKTPTPADVGFRRLLQSAMDLRQQLSLIDTMARMALKADAARYYFGYVWWVLEPLLFVAVFYLVFELILGAEREDFLVFLMCGKLTFVWFSKSVTHAARSIVVANGLIGRIDVPKVLFPMAVLQEGLYKQAAVFVLLFAVVVGSGFGPHASWLWLAPLVLVNYLMILACALAGAFVVCLMFDISLLISLGMTFLLFTSGVFWDVRALEPATTQAVLLYNPLAFVIDAYRQILMQHSAPDLWHLGLLGLACAALSALMVYLLQRYSQFIALRAITA